MKYILHFRFTDLFVLTIVGFALFFGGAVGVRAQERTSGPDLSVAGLKLGDRESGKAFLAAYQPRTTEARPTYYFYNKNADTVMKVTAASTDDSYFVTEIEVFAVDQTYRSPHFQLEKIDRFSTSSGIFIGWKQSGKGIAASLIIGLPYPLGVNSIGPKDVVSRYGEPAVRNKKVDAETLDYRLDTMKVENTGKYGYAAHFEFYKRNLGRFSIKLVAGVTP